MGLSDIATGIGRLVEDAQEGVAGLFEPVIRLGVTGLARSGKTVFITALVANLLDRGRMTQLAAEASGRIEAAYLQPQPDDAVPRFDIEGHLATLTAPEPHWPESTRSISELRLSLRVRPARWLSGLTGPRTVHLDIVDYPGEWLLDLPLLSKPWAEWSAEALAAAAAPPRRELSAPFLAAVAAADPASPLDESVARALAEAFRASLSAGRAAGLSALAPGRFLMPGDLGGSPLLTFAPLPPAPGARSGSLARAFERRYDSYRREVVKPFFRDHFARIDRQVVLMDVLGAMQEGPRAVGDLQTAMAGILDCFRHGRQGWLGGLLGTRIDRILFCATRADHLHHSQHDRLTAIAEALLAGARDRARYRGALTRAMAIASLRATVEDRVSHLGRPLDVVRGRLLDTGREAALHVGDLPDSPGAVLGAAAAGAARWASGDYGVMRFAPPRLARRPGEGPPHIRLDRALDFLIGDRLE